MEDPKEIVRPFYTQCLTVNADTNVAEKMNQILASNFQSKSAADVKTKEQLIGQIQFFWKLIPDLKWEIQEMIQEGDQVVAPRKRRVRQKSADDGKTFSADLLQGDLFRHAMEVGRKGSADDLLLERVPASLARHGGARPGQQRDGQREESRTRDGPLCVSRRWRQAQEHSHRCSLREAHM